MRTNITILTKGRKFFEPDPHAVDGPSGTQKKRDGLNYNHKKKLVKDYRHRLENNKLINSIFVNTRNELLDEDDDYEITQPGKCPEIRVSLNGVCTIALLDSGTQISAVSSAWYEQNKKTMDRVETLKATGVSIKGAVSIKSKSITKQIFVQVEFGEHTCEGVFLVIPDLICDCIIGITAEATE